MRSTYSLDGRRLADLNPKNDGTGAWLCNRSKEDAKRKPCTTSPNTLALKKAERERLYVEPQNPRLSHSRHDISRRQKRALKRKRQALAAKLRGAGY